MTQFAFNIVVLLALFVWFPAIVTVLGLRSLKRANKPLTRFGSVLLFAAGAVPLSLVAVFAFRSLPGHDGIACSGQSPDGHEFCLVQSHNGFPAWISEPYTVSLYVRDGSGQWHWHYVDHQALAIRSSEVSFDGSTALVTLDGDAQRPIELERLPGLMAPRTYDDAKVLPADMTADEVARVHTLHVRG